MTHRNFPSLINCCTIDWYLAWPKEALLDVALTCVRGELTDPQIQDDEDSLEHLERSDSAENDENLQRCIAQVCVSIHGMIGNMTEDYYNETKRRIYVTPRSFLDLLHLYRYLLKRETAELQDRHDKFSTGLKKMSEITVVIKQSKCELDLLRPVLEEKAAKTEELLKKVTRDTKKATEAKNQVALETEEVEHQANTVRMIQVLTYVRQTRMCARVYTCVQLHT